MTTRAKQFCVTDLLVIIGFVAVNFWMFRLGPFWAATAVVLDKHVLVAYLCMKLKVAQTARPRARTIEVRTPRAQGLMPTEH